MPSFVPTKRANIGKVVVVPPPTPATPVLLHPSLIRSNSSSSDFKMLGGRIPPPCGLLLDDISVCIDVGSALLYVCI